jgi:His/Glu/Gln/Arg/opine family amino acid ABC transporter permease subunit
MHNISTNPGAPGPDSKASGRRDIVSYLFDIRFLQAVGQIVFVILLVAVFSRIITDMFLALEAQNLQPDYAFFENRAGFEISESPEWYSPDSSYWDAFRVGLINTLRVVIGGLIGATLLGILFGIFLLSNNWLVRSISRVYVELLRNTPLLVQLFAWYFVAVLSLPIMREAIALPQEGVWLLPVRLAIYVLALVLILRRYPGGEPMRMPYLLGLGLFFVATELAFSSFQNQPYTGTEGGVGVDLAAGVRSLHGAGEIGYGPFQLYAILSIAAVLVAWFSPRLLLALRGTEEDVPVTLNGGLVHTRNILLGVTVGQFLGGLAFYFGIIPAQTIRSEIYPLIFLSNRGFVFPEVFTTARFNEWLAFVGLGVLAAVAIWIYFGRLTETTGRQFPRVRYAALLIAGLAVAGWLLIRFEPQADIIIEGDDGQPMMMTVQEAREDGLLTLEEERLVSQSPVIFARPERKGLRFAVGLQISPEYMALFLGLTIYTSAFIAEIVRAGIQAVPHGQIEAARALGLSQAQTLRMVVLPQALRVIIPPLGNQFLNLAKNSSLAIAIGFADFYNVSNTIMNQSGQSVTGMSIVMLVYLTISLTLSGGANWVNRRFQLVTR